VVALNRLRKCLSCTCFWGETSDLHDGTNSAPSCKCVNTVTLPVNTITADRYFTHYSHCAIGSIPGSDTKFLSKESRPTLEPTSDIFQVLWRKGHKTDHFPPVNGEVKNVWSYFTTPPYAVMAQCSNTENNLKLCFHHCEKANIRQ
jgi:hypothetical protein